MSRARPAFLAAAVALPAALAFAMPCAAGTVYKWTDQRGVVNYSTTPPPDAQRLVTVDTSPALAAFGSIADDEANAWRERQRRALAREARELESLRARRETDEWRQQQFRHQMQLSAQAATSDEMARRLAREQCLRERRVDCDQAGAGAGYAYYPAPVVVVRRAPQNIRQVSPFPVTGPTTGPAPGTIAGTQAQLAPFRAAPAAVSASAGLRLPR